LLFFAKNMALMFNSQNFNKEVLNSNLPVLVDFWAPWCAPCQIMGPIIDNLAKKYEGKIKIGKLNVDENPDIAADYDIRGIPTLKIFKNGQVISEIVGLHSETDLKEKLNKLI